jgi:acetyl esterase/lipase
MGDNTSEASLAAISPVNFADSSFPPAMILTGNRDEIVDWHDSQAMYTKLIEAGARAELHVFDGQPHAFDASPAFGRQCASLMALFLDRYVLDPG